MDDDCTPRAVTWPLYATLIGTLAMTMVLIAVLLAPVTNALVIPHLGAELHGPHGEPLPLDEPASAPLSR